MNEIHTKMASRQDDIKLYMEVADKPINDKVYNCCINFRISAFKFKTYIIITFVDMVSSSRRKLSYNDFPQTF